jgi:hypothetical protein
MTGPAVSLARVARYGARMSAPRPDASSNEWPTTGQGNGPGPAETPATALGTVAVLLPLPLADAYDYRVPQDMALAPGDFVSVPLGKRQLAGVVWGPPRGDIDPAKLRDVERTLPVPPMGEAMRRFVAWVAAYTLTPPGAVLRMAMSVPDALEPPRPETVYRLAAAAGDVAARAAVKLTAARQRVLQFLAAAPALSLVEVARQAGVGTAVVKALVDAGVVEAVQRPPRRAAEAWAATPGPSLSEAQAAAAADLVAKVQARRFSTTLLDGVPGAGKTEVYFEAIAAALAQGRQALVLLPEIALSAQWLERFARRFGTRPTEWHSDLTGAERRRAWRDVAENRARVVVGARSACSCRSPILASSWSTKSTTVPSSRRMARCTTPATWPWCVPGWPVRRLCWPRPRRRWRASPTSAPAATTCCTCPTVTAVPVCRASRSSTCAATRRRAVAGWRRRSRPPCATRWHAASRHCCFSIAAATRRSRCAVPAATACNVRIAAPGWWSIASAAG